MFIFYDPEEQIGFNSQVATRNEFHGDGTARKDRVEKRKVRGEGKGETNVVIRPRAEKVPDQISRYSRRRRRYPRGNHDR